MKLEFASNIPVGTFCKTQKGDVVKVLVQNPVMKKTTLSILVSGYGEQNCEVKDDYLLEQDPSCEQFFNERRCEIMAKGKVKKDRKGTVAGVLRKYITSVDNPKFERGLELAKEVNPKTKLDENHFKWYILQFTGKHAPKAERKARKPKASKPKASKPKASKPADAPAVPPATPAVAAPQA
jgi:hypothetical protein